MVSLECFIRFASFRFTLPNYKANKSIRSLSNLINNSIFDSNDINCVSLFGGSSDLHFWLHRNWDSLKLKLDGGG